MEVDIYYNKVRKCLEIYFLNRDVGKLFVAKPMQFNWVEHKECESVEPSLRISDFYASDLLKALAEALDKKGIKTENDFKIQGLLEATKYHLNDMRRLVFGKNKRRKM